MRLMVGSVSSWGAAAGVAAASLWCAAIAGSGATAQDLAVPRYSNVFVIVDENKGYAEVLGGKDAPVLARLAKRYGVATRFYAEVHPSEGNYVAMISGDTYGIHDDDAFYCSPGLRNAYCGKSLQPGYVNHTVTQPHLGSQLEAHDLSWKAYYETLPSPGSKAVVASDPNLGPAYANWPLYASKHSGFMNFASVQHSPARAVHIVGFDQLSRDLASRQLPAFALIVPNQCNDMHGLNPAHYAGAAALIPADCKYDDIPGLVRRGDAAIAKIVGAIQNSSVWTSSRNVAIVITFDEGSGDTPEGCCGIDPSSKANFGGGRIPTIVVTNHGPHGVVDNTPYSHYSLLRTLEDAFGIHDYLAHAADTSKGVKPMLPLFRAGSTPKPSRYS